MLDYRRAPVGYMVEGLRNYFEHGVVTGSFLSALLCNDLKETVACADSMNRDYLVEWVHWLYNEAPAGSWGSREAVQEWSKARAQAAEDAHQREMGIVRLKP